MVLYKRVPPGGTSIKVKKKEKKEYDLIHDKIRFKKRKAWTCGGGEHPNIVVGEVSPL